MKKAGEKEKGKNKLMRALKSDLRISVNLQEEINKINKYRHLEKKKCSGTSDSNFINFPLFSLYRYLK